MDPYSHSVCSGNGSHETIQPSHAYPQDFCKSKKLRGSASGWKRPSLGHSNTLQDFEGSIRSSDGILENPDLSSDEYSWANQGSFQDNLAFFKDHKVSYDSKDD